MRKVHLEVMFLLIVIVVAAIFAWHFWARITGGPDTRKLQQANLILDREALGLRSIRIEGHGEPTVLRYRECTSDGSLRSGPVLFADWRTSSMAWESDVQKIFKELLLNGFAPVTDKQSVSSFNSELSRNSKGQTITATIASKDGDPNVIEVKIQVATLNPCE
jgi:hypothetical protein